MSLPNIRCERTTLSRMHEGGRCLVSIRQEVVHHSPDGFEWGYGGSGPADLALNVLHIFAPPKCDGRDPVPLYRGECSAFAWENHQDFKRQFIATMPDEGGFIGKAEVIAWIRERWPEYQPPA